MGRRGSSPRGSSGRSGSGGGFFGRSNKAAPAKQSAPAAAPAPPPARVQSQPPAQTQTMQSAPSMGGGMGGGLLGTIAQGMAFGTGSAVAHRAVDAVAGPRTVQHEYVESSTTTTTAAAAGAGAGGARACDNQMNDFNKCLQDNKGNVSSCQFYYDLLNQCQRQ